MWFSVGLEERSVRSDMWSGTPLCVEDLTLCCGEEEDFFSWRGQEIIVIVMWGGDKCTRQQRPYGTIEVVGLGSRTR